MTKKKSWSISGSHLGADPEFFAAWTLFDIGPLTAESRDNLATIMHIVTNRGQPLLAGIECIEDQDVANSLFGENITGTQRVWCFKWIADRIGLMSEDSLAAESNGAPMNTGLDETLALPNKIIIGGPDANTFYIRHDSF